MAEPDWTLYLDDSFDRSDTTVGSGADNNTGVPGAPTTGPSDGWYDHEGNKFYISSSQLKRSGNTNSWSSTGLYRAAAEATLDQRVVITYPAGNTPSAIYMRCAGSGGASIWFQPAVAVANGIGILSGWNSFGGFVSMGGSAWTVDGSKAHTVDVRVWGTNPTNWRVIVTNTTDGVQIYDKSGNTTGLRETAGVIGLDGPTQSGGVVDRIQAYVAGFQVGTLSPDASTTTLSAVGLTIGSTVGGTAPVSVALHRSTDPQATLGAGTTIDDVTGDTSTTDTPGGTAGTTYYYWLRATDSTSPTPQTSTTPPIPASTKIAHYKILYIGDSITNGIEASTAGLLKSTFEGLYPKYLTTTTRQGVDSTSTDDWLPGSSNLNAALSAGSSAGATIASIMLGTNDARNAVANSTADYKAQLLAICEELIDNGYTCILHAPPCYNLPYNSNESTNGGYGAAAYARLTTYAGAQDELVNGTTILRGDRQAFLAFSAAPSTYFQDQVHPNSAGRTLLVKLWDEAIGAALGIAGDGPNVGGGVGRANMNGGFN